MARREHSPCEVFFTLVGQAGSSIVERAAVPLAARPGSAIAAVAVWPATPIAAALARETC